MVSAAPDLQIRAQPGGNLQIPIGCHLREKKILRYEESSLEKAALPSSYPVPTKKNPPTLTQIVKYIRIISKLRSYYCP